MRYITSIFGNKWLVVNYIIKSNNFTPLQFCFSQNKLVLNAAKCLASEPKLVNSD